MHVDLVLGQEVAAAVLGVVFCLFDPTHNILEALHDCGVVDNQNGVCLHVVGVSLLRELVVPSKIVEVKLRG